MRHTQQRIADLARLLTWAYLLAEGSSISPAGIAAVTQAGIAIPDDAERMERKAAEAEAYHTGRLDAFRSDMQRYVTTKRSKREDTLPWPEAGPQRYEHERPRHPTGGAVHLGPERRNPERGGESAAPGRLPANGGHVSSVPAQQSAGEADPFNLAG